MKWLNPFTYVALMMAYTKEHFWAWNLSSAWTIAQFWAADLIQVPGWWYSLKEFAAVVGEWAASGNISP